MNYMERFENKKEKMYSDLEKYMYETMEKSLKEIFKNHFPKRSFYFNDCMGSVSIRATYKNSEWVFRSDSCYTNSKGYYVYGNDFYPGIKKIKDLLQFYEDNTRVYEREILFSVDDLKG